MRIGVTPFFNKNKNLLLTKIQRAKVIFPDKEKYGLDYSDDFVDIVEKLLNKNSSKRLGSKNDVHEILDHPWFKDLDISALEAQKITPPLKPDLKEGTVDFKYFNLKQQSMVDSFMPPEKQ
jgi:serine/threonine protein kinase